jgi:hypothetical protein
MVKSYLVGGRERMCAEALADEQSSGITGSRSRVRRRIAKMGLAKGTRYGACNSS